MVKIDLWTGRIIEEEKAKPTEPPKIEEIKQEIKEETKPPEIKPTEIKPEDIREFIEKGRELWRKLTEAIETMKERAEKRKIEKIFEEAGVPIVKEKKKNVLEELGIEKV